MEQAVAARLTVHAILFLNVLQISTWSVRNTASSHREIIDRSTLQCAIPDLRSEPGKPPRDPPARHHRDGSLPAVPGSRQATLVPRVVFDCQAATRTPASFGPLQQSRSAE